MAIYSALASSNYSLLACLPLMHGKLIAIPKTEYIIIYLASIFYTFREAASAGKREGIEGLKKCAKPVLIVGVFSQI